MRICSGPGCLRSVPDDVRFCDDCKPVGAPPDDIRSHTTGYTDELDALHKGTRWQRVRSLVIKRDPLCRRCGRYISEIVDHIVPAREAIAQAQLSGRYPLDRNAGYYLQSNLQGLCRPCHHAKTEEDKTHVGPWPDVVEAEALAPKKVWTF
ncbi:MAG: HNH endonuclease [Syntrophorhabdales bacterium]|jgi:5-methylcytosine-specific restriction endonuclease McrA